MYNCKNKTKYTCFFLIYYNVVKHNTRTLKKHTKRLPKNINLSFETEGTPLFFHTTFTYSFYIL